MQPAALDHRVPTVGVEDALRARGARVVDLRSESEYAEDHLPGAVHVPLFSDVERAIIGTLYAKSSPQAAFGEARQIAARRIRALASEIARIAGWEVPPEDLAARLLAMTSGGIEAFAVAVATEPAERSSAAPLVCYCWRGGLRSRSVVAFLRALGLASAVALEHGYRGYRRAVIDEIERWKAPCAFVLRGLTGVGKTLVLEELERLRPTWTVDLEALAAHRSSILGMVGREPFTQRAFESNLARRLREGFRGPVVFEGESRKVGDAIIPESVWRALDSGLSLELAAPLERRVQVLTDDYLEREENRAELAQRLPFIEQRLGSRKWKGRLVALLAAHSDRELAALLLEHYYDPLYRHSEKGRSYAATFDATDPAAAAAAIASWIERHRA